MKEDGVAFHIKRVVVLVFTNYSSSKTSCSVKVGRSINSSAGGMSTWQPQEEGFKEICGLLEQQISHVSSADKSQIWQHLQRYSHLPDFNNYLTFIFSRAEVFFFFFLSYDYFFSSICFLPSVLGTFFFLS